MGSLLSNKSLEGEPEIDLELLSKEGVLPLDGTDSNWLATAVNSNGKKRSFGDSSQEKEKRKKKGRSNGRHAIGQAIIEPSAVIDFKSARDHKDYLTSILVKYQETLARKARCQLGYPGRCYDYHDTLAPLLRFHINNIGDPFICGNYAVHSREFEIGVLEWFAKLWQIEKDEYWGYVTNGGTEGNLHGLLIGREMLPDGVLYTSRDSHYSIFKAAKLLKIDCEIISSLVSGKIDLVDLHARLLRNKDKPAIVNVNIGTTFKGALDDLDLVLQTLQECGFTHDRFYIHCDAALSGLVVSSLENAPKITFKKPIGSISVSGHKFLGCPMPCGVQMTRKRHIDLLAKNIELIASSDATISGSRNGHCPIYLRYSLSMKGHIGIQRDAKRCLENAQYLRNPLMEEGISAMLNDLSIAVAFERRFEDFVRR